jgi:DNA-directed RNA polymerase subunit RPC12/RpoP
MDKGVGYMAFWECPYCGNIVSGLQLQSFRYDYGCLRCGTPFVHFLPVRDEAGDDMRVFVRQVLCAQGVEVRRTK